MPRVRERDDMVDLEVPRVSGRPCREWVVPTSDSDRAASHRHRDRIGRLFDQHLMAGSDAVSVEVLSLVERIAVVSGTIRRRLADERCKFREQRRKTVV
jgi:hypothetical protein